MYMYTRVGICVQNIQYSIYTCGMYVQYMIKSMRPIQCKATQHNNMYMYIYVQK